MTDLTKNLPSLSFENGLSESEKELLRLRARSAALSFCGCAQALFLCQLFQSLRSSIKKQCGNKSRLLSGDLRVGIVGMGHLGKQLLLSLLEKTQITASNIKVSTRRPECAEHVAPGVECFFDNERLAQWADVLFLCCLPSHLPTVCAELSPHLTTQTLVYSFPSAVPIPRLVQLLGHNFVVKSHYDADACDCSDVWMSRTHLKAALKDPFLIKLSCPLRPNGNQHKPPLGLNWMCAVLYSLVNMCTALHLEWKDTLNVINHLFKDKLSQSLEMNAQSVISSSTLCMSADELFPWISVSDAQTMETPLYRFVNNSKSTQECIVALYSAILVPNE